MRNPVDTGIDLTHGLLAIVRLPFDGVGEGVAEVQLAALAHLELVALHDTGLHLGGSRYKVLKLSVVRRDSARMVGRVVNLGKNRDGLLVIIARIVDDEGLDQLSRP